MTAPLARTASTAAAAPVPPAVEPTPDTSAIAGLLAAEDPDSVERLSVWLKGNARTFAPVVSASLDAGTVSAPAAAAVLDALIWRAPADGRTTLELTEACLSLIARRVSDALAASPTRTVDDSDDALVGSAVAAVTGNRRSRSSETAIACLGAGGPGGALILARAFDAVRGALKLSIVRRLHPQDVLALDDNVVASLASSLARLAEEVEPGPKHNSVTRLLAQLGPVPESGPAEITAAQPLKAGERVFHASWGIGTVVSTGDDNVTIDFGGAGTRTLLRSLTTLRRAH